MIVHALRGAGLDPAYVVGGELPATGSNAGWGSGEWIVVEADESDRSLLKLSPQIAVLTNAELDHHATYTSRLELDRTFEAFMASASEHAVVWNRPELLALCPPGASAYDAPDPVLEPSGSRFAWRGREVVLTVPGAHNAVNAAGALTAAALAGADPDRAAAALRDFTGARRRFERLGETALGVAVYDDYAHHPTEVAAALAAARTLSPKRLIAVFQPHLYLAHPGSGPGVRARAGRRGRRRRARRLSARASARRTSLAWTGGSSPPRPPMPATGARWPGCRASTRPASSWPRPCARAICLLVMGAGNVDALGRSMVAGRDSS